MVKRNSKIKKIIACSQIFFLFGMVSNDTISTDASVQMTQFIGDNNFIFSAVDSSRNIINSSIKIIDSDTAQEVQSNNNEQGVYQYKLDEGSKYKYEVSADGYKEITGEFTYSKENTNIEIHLIKNDEDQKIPSAPRIKGYCNYNNETVDYESGNAVSGDVTLVIDNSYADTAIRGYKLILKDLESGEPSDDEWNQEEEKTGDDILTVNGKTKKYNLDIKEAGNRKIFVRAVSDGGIMGLISQFEINIKDTYPNLYINNNLTNDSTDDEVWYKNIPDIKVTKGNNPKYNEEYQLIDSENNIAAQGKIENITNINIKNQGIYKLILITKDQEQEINRQERKIKIETECEKPVILVNTVDSENTTDIYSEGQWVNRDVTIKADESKSIASVSGLKGYKLIEKTFSEQSPTEEEWNSISDDNIIKQNSNSNITDLLTINNDFNGIVYIRKITNAGTESDIYKINVKVKKTAPDKPFVKINGINESGWYTSGLKSSDIEIENSSNDLKENILAEVYDEQKQTKTTIDITDRNYDKLIQILNNDGKYKIKIWTVDEAGNNSDAYEQELNIDINAPTDYKISYMINPASNADIYSIFKDMVKVRIYAFNDFSGIKSIVPKINDKLSLDNISCDDLSVKTTDDGLHYIEFEVRSQFMGEIAVNSIEDNAGNKSNADQTKNVSDNNMCIVDSEKPEKPVISAERIDSISNAKSKYVSDTWVKDDVEVSILGSKVLSGVAYYEYVVKNSDETEPTEEDWKNAIKIGEEELKNENKVENSSSNILLGTLKTDTNKKYYVRAVSRVGIKGEISSINIKVKKTKPKAPVVNVKKVNDYGWYTEKFIQNDISYSNYYTDIGLKTYAQIVNLNNPSDSKIIDISDSDKKGKINSKVVEALNNEGKYNLKIYTIDEAGNRSNNWPENSDGLNIYNDYTEPDSFSIEYVSMPVSGAKGYNIFNNDCVVRIYSKDDISGIKQINYHMADEYKTINVNLESDIKKDGNRQYVEFIISPEYKGRIILDSVLNNAGLQTIVTPNNSITSDNGGIKNIIVDNKKPTSPIISAGSYINNSWTMDNVNLRIEGSNALSGIKHYRYIVNNGEVPSEAQWNDSAVLNGYFSDSSSVLTSNENLISSISNLNSDLNKTFWFRAESNAGILGDISNYNVKIQKTAPKNTSVQYNKPNGEGWYNSSPYIKIDDIKPLERQAPIYIHYKLWNKTAGESENSVNEIVYNGNNMPVISSDGEYTLKVWTVDEVGNRSSESLDIVKDFNVDTTMPVISLNYDNNNALNEKYYNKKRDAILTVNDTNFNPDKVNIKITSLNNGNVVETSGNSWNTQGVSHSTTIPFDSDGDYKIEAICKDKADNSSDNIASNDFVIDMTEPALEISNVENLSANNTDVNPTIKFNDTNIDFDNVSYTLKGLQSGEVSMQAEQSTDENGKNISLSAIDNDDNYVLSAKATDKAGNSIDKQVAFSVNKNGSTFEYLNDNITNGYVTESFKPKIRINNIDEVTILSLTLNGKPADYTYEDGVVTFNDDINVDGKYVINLDVKDAAGNKNSMEPIEFILDQTSPKVLIDGIEDGEIYNDKVKITISKDNSYDNFDCIELNGRDMIKEGKVNSDGTITFEVSDYDKYELKVKASDVAGNVTEKNVSFKIGKSILGISGAKKIVLSVCCAIVAAAGVLFVGIRFLKKK